MMWLWFAVAIGFLVLELITTQFISIWFAVSALITGIIKVIANDLPMTWQIVIFVVLSAILVAASRPLVKKYLKKGDEAKTNMDLNIGKKVIVTETINNIEEKGLVKLNGIIWTARSDDDSIIEQDSLVTIKQFEGNKIIVSRIDNTEENK